MEALKIPTMYTLKQASDATGLTYEHLRELCLRNKIVYIRVGRKYLINMGKLIEYMEQGEKMNYPMKKQDIIDSISSDTLFSYQFCKAIYAHTEGNKTQNKAEYRLNPLNCENQKSRIVKCENQEITQSKIKNCENQNSGISRIKIQEFPKSKSNNTEYSDTDISDTEYSDIHIGGVCNRKRNFASDWREVKQRLELSFL